MSTSTETLPPQGSGLVELGELCRMHSEDLAALRAKEAVEATVQPVHSAVAAIVGEQAA